jgi:hypothetical protein
MRKALFIIFGGLAAGCFILCLVYFIGTRQVRELSHQPEPGLIWLKHEYKLNEGEFARISQLHAAYLPDCTERCRAIQKVTDEIREKLAARTEVTPEIENLFRERSRQVAECQLAMLRHFQAVSREMTPAQGERYLAWVEENTCLSHHMPGIAEGSARAHSTTMQ